MSGPSWKLDDADPIAAENPYTFYKPSRELIAQLRAGELVKLIFRFDSSDPEAPTAERMWVEIEEVLPDGSFRGRLNNDPMYIKDLKADDPVSFGACHIINTEHDDSDNLVERYIKRCFVTNRVLEDGQRVGYFYREEPEAENDSGWRFTANDESDEYMSDSDNVAYVSLGAVLSKDDSFLDLLESPVGCAFVLDADSGGFVAVERDEFVWRTEVIHATVVRGDDGVFGQHLNLDQQLRPDEGGWSNMKISLPEHWQVESVAVKGDRIQLSLVGGKRYSVGRDNVGELSFQVADGGPGKSAEILEKIWNACAGE